MPPAEVQAAAGGGQGQQGQQQQPGQSLLTMILRMAMMYYVMSWLRGPQNQQAGPAGVAHHVFRRGELVDTYLYISESQYLNDRSEGTLVWQESGIPLGTTTERLLETTYVPSKAVQQNGSVYLHAYIARSGVDLDGDDDEIPANSVFTKTFRLALGKWWHTGEQAVTAATLVAGLIKYMPRPRNETGVNLLSGEAVPATEQQEGPQEWMSFWKPNATLGFVDHFQSYSKASIPPQIANNLQYTEDGNLFPIVAWDEFWLLRDKLIPVNETVEELPLALRIKALNFWWLQLQQQMEQSFKMQQGFGMVQEGESDEVKRIFLEGNPVLLAITMVVSMLHTVFDFFAFKNDIGFWRENKSMEGLSARSILINAACQLIIFLYLLDNETSMVVLLSSGVGTAIEFWKVTKAMDVSFDPGRFPYIIVKDKAGYNDSNTKQHDADATRYLSYVLYPLIIGYSIYTLYYNKHKSWYSWILNSLVGAVYTFGFILMCPQLYLNYKLKSVAHLPWRQMTYKFLNTIIDDLFAFVIKMPVLHRLSVFRDDVIFLIYLYQRWIYPIDKNRVNEFGYSESSARPPAVANGDAAANAPAITEGAGEAQQQGSGTSRRRKPTAATSPEAAAEAPAAGSGKDSKKAK